MTDLLSHVFVAYSICIALSWRIRWIKRRHITLGMVGALIPELVKIRLLISNEFISGLIQAPFAWESLSTVVGVFLSIFAVVTMLSKHDRKAGALTLTLGAISHLALDSLNYTPSGRSQQLFWPIIQERIISPGLYLSTDPEPAIVTGLIALVIYSLDRNKA